MPPTTMRASAEAPSAVHPVRSLHRVPWQLWIAVTMLSLEGVGNLLSIPQEPLAAYWLAAKCLFVVGLIRGWPWVFVLFLVFAGLHVVGFSTQAPSIAFLNLVLVLLVGSALRFFFPADQRYRPTGEAKLKPPGSLDQDFSA